MISGKAWGVFFKFEPLALDDRILGCDDEKQGSQKERRQLVIARSMGASTSQGRNEKKRTISDTGLSGHLSKSCIIDEQWLIGEKFKTIKTK